MGLAARAAKTIGRLSAARVFRHITPGSDRDIKYYGVKLANAGRFHEPNIGGADRRVTHVLPTGWPHGTGERQRLLCGCFHDYWWFCLGTRQKGDNTSDKQDHEWHDLGGYFGSAMEHGMIEQLQSSSLIAASTVKILETANTNHKAIYLANSANWSVVQTKLSNYNINDLTTYLINPGYNVLLPQNGSVTIGSRTFFGIVGRNTTGSSMSMIVGPGIYGGYAGNTGATVDPNFIDYSAYSQPLYFSSSPVSVPNFTGADPVNMADGTFQVQATDLSLGQTEPRGLSFSRYYNSSRRNSNLAGMAPGWIHNYYLNAATVSSPQAGLGGTTPAQMASILVATPHRQPVFTMATNPIQRIGWSRR